MSKKPKNGKSIFDDKRITLVVAVLLGVLFWVIVAGFIMPSDSNTIRGIPISYTDDEQTYLDRGLQIVGTPAVNYAEVFVRGDGSQLGGLRREDFHVWVDYERVTEPGQQEVPIVVEKLSSATFEVYDYSISSGEFSLDGRIKIYVTLTFEKVSTKNFDIVARADEVTAATNYFRDSVTVNPGTVNIRGPESHVSQVSQVVAEVAAVTELTENGRYEDVELKLLNAQGDELDPDALELTLSVTTADVSVVINEVRTIGLAATFIGMPNNFDSEWFYERISLSVDELEVVGPAAAFEHLENPYPVAEFDISQLSLRWESGPINITMPEDSGLRINDQLRYVTVSFDTTGMVEKTFEIPGGNISVVNGPMNATIKPMSDTMTVKLIGPEEQINALLPENIFVQVDAFSVSATQVGTQLSLPARVRVPVANRCFAVENYSIICDVVAD